MTVREAFNNEYGYTSEGSGGGIWRMIKFAAQNGINLPGCWVSYRTRNVTQSQTVYTEWLDIDEASGTIYTDAC